MHTQEHDVQPASDNARRIVADPRYRLSGRVITFRTSLAMEDAIAEVLRATSDDQMASVDRTTVARQLLALGIEAWRERRRLRAADGSAAVTDSSQT